MLSELRKQDGLWWGPWPDPVVHCCFYPMMQQSLPMLTLVLVHLWRPDFSTSTLLAAALSPPFTPLHPRAQTEWCALPLQDELRKGLGRFHKNPHELFPWGFLGSRVWDEDIPFLHEARKVGWKLTLLF